MHKLLQICLLLILPRITPNITIAQEGHRSSPIVVKPAANNAGQGINGNLVAALEAIRIQKEKAVEAVANELRKVGKAREELLQAERISARRAEENLLRTEQTMAERREFLNQVVEIGRASCRERV